MRSPRDRLTQFREGPTLAGPPHQPHGMMVMNAVNAQQHFCPVDVATIAEAVGSDITNVVNEALKTGQIGAAQLVLSNYLSHELPVAGPPIHAISLLKQARRLMR